MVHCGDGLDASLQVTSITNILLNSGLLYYYVAL